MEDRSFSATDILTTTVTVAGLAIALVTIEPKSPAVPGFLVASLFSTAGSLYALSAPWEETGLTPGTVNQSRMEAAQEAMREVNDGIPERDGRNVVFRI